MKKSFSACMLTIAFATFGVTGASAQTTSTFMLVPGIPGGATQERHAGWIEVMSLRQTFGVQLKGGSLCDVEVVKGLDISGPRLWAAAVTGQVFPEVTIEVIREGADQQKMYEIKLTSARVLSISTTGDSAFAESVTLSPASATLSVFTQRPDGSVGPPVTNTFSCK
jgi:type VI secretion system Hcp family effector